MHLWALTIYICKLSKFLFNMQKSIGGSCFPITSNTLHDAEMRLETSKVKAEPKEDAPGADSKTDVAGPALPTAAVFGMNSKSLPLSVVISTMSRFLKIGVPRGAPSPCFLVHRTKLWGTPTLRHPHII